MSTGGAHPLWITCGQLVDTPWIFADNPLILLSVKHGRCPWKRKHVLPVSNFLQGVFYKDDFNDIEAAGYLGFSDVSEVITGSRKQQFSLVSIDGVHGAPHPLFVAGLDFHKTELALLAKNQIDFSASCAVITAKQFHPALLKNLRGDGLPFAPQPQMRRFRPAKPIPKCQDSHHAANIHHSSHSTIGIIRRNGVYFYTCFQQPIIIKTRSNK